jgi:hypothetical protein
MKHAWCDELVEIKMLPYKIQPREKSIGSDSDGSWHIGETRGAILTTAT